VKINFIGDEEELNVKEISKKKGIFVGEDEESFPTLGEED